MAAVRREEHVQKGTTTMDRTTATTGTMDTPVEERRAAMKGISTQFTQYSEEQNSTVTAIEMEKYRTKNRPCKVNGVRGVLVPWREHTWLLFGFIATQD